MTLAPRAKETYNIAINSLRAAGFSDRITIFMEPSYYNFEDNNLLLVKNKKKFGCFKNYNHGLNYLLKHTKKSFIFIIQDDYIFDSNIFHKLDSIISLDIKNIGYFSPLLNIRMAEKLQVSVAEGWQESTIGWGSWGACYIMPVESVYKLLKHPFYTNHLYKYKKNEQIDACVSETFKKLGLKMLFYSPSLVDHVGDKSTLSHDASYDKTRGFRFGE